MSDHSSQSDYDQNDIDENNDDGFDKSSDLDYTEIPNINEDDETQLTPKKGTNKTNKKKSKQRGNTIYSFYVI